ncbi:MAG: hypothetical protein K6G73_09925 [Marinilabiliaceae bacterium]|nr:hypothetical protein [Marinilabiliaceae bacterium]
MESDKNQNQIKKDKREWTIINLFSSAYEQFPIGNLKKSERPDFILTTPKKRIGIELTELKYERDDTKFNMRAHEDFLSEIMDNAQAIYNKQKNLYLVVDVHFSDCIAPLCVNMGGDDANLIKQGLSESISRIVIDNLPEATGKHYIVNRTSKYGDVNLPSMIDAINITNVTGRQTEALWFASISTRVKPLTVQSISQRIHDKDKKIVGYDATCDNQWLVIIQNSFLMAEKYDPVAAARALRHHYHSRFDKVFVFERSEAQVTPLITSKLI